LASLGLLTGFAAAAAPKSIGGPEPRAGGPPAESSAGESNDPQPGPPRAGQETFPSADLAAHALVNALHKDDQAALLKILGGDAKNIVSSGDDAEDKADRASFVEKFKQMHRFVMEPDGTTTTLYIGAENWPTPIPLVHKGDTWYFDTAAGKDEILYRRIGKNELTAIQVCGELVDAQKEYYPQPHDGDANQYAQKLYSDPGKHNGLYWQASSGEKPSPIGPLIAEAAGEGDSGSQQRQPFQGYYFQILKGEGHSKSYVVDGKMTGGFAFVAYPAEYRSSGVMTFVVNQDGIVYEKDLGPKTAETAKTLTRYDRDASWRKAD
jgi:hypothetical protein